MDVRMFCNGFILVCDIDYFNDLNKQCYELDTMNFYLKVKAKSKLSYLLY